MHAKIDTSWSRLCKLVAKRRLDRGMTNEILGGDGIGDEAPSGEALASDSMAYQSLVGSGLVALSLSDVY